VWAQEEHWQALKASGKEASPGWPLGQEPFFVFIGYCRGTQGARC